MKFSKQCIINLIAKTATESKSIEERTNVIQGLLTTYKIAKDFDKSFLTQINKLDGLDLDSGIITDFEALEDSADLQLDQINLGALAQMQKLIIDEKKTGELTYAQTQIREELIDMFKSSGYQVLELETVVKGDKEAIEHINKWISDERDLEAFIDTRIQDDGSLSVWMPAKYYDEIDSIIHMALDFTKTKANTATKQVVELIPGCKDFIDVEAAFKRQQEFRKEEQLSR